MTSQPAERGASVAGARMIRRTRSNSDPPVAASATLDDDTRQLSSSTSALRVVRGVAARLDRDFVAAVLAFRTHARGHPPDRRVIEQHRLGQRLQQVDEVVVAADVSQFVGQD